MEKAQIMPEMLSALTTEQLRTISRNSCHSLRRYCPSKGVVTEGLGFQKHTWFLWEII